MAWASSEIVGVLVFLLPGFVAAAIFHAFTSYPKPSAFERVILALIFTAIVQAVVALLPDSIPSATLDIGADAPWEPVWPVAVAVALAFVVVLVVNYDLAHKLFRWLRVTRETAYPSPWYSSFFRHTGYVVLHLNGGRRLLGWPEEWSNDPKTGHIRLSDAEWLHDPPVDQEGDELASVSRQGQEASPPEVEILVRVRDVEMVEFLD